jgi:outer membrane protein
MYRAVVSIVVAAWMCGFSGQLSAAEFKVGFVDVAKILDTAPQAEKARSAIEREFAPRDRKLLQQQKELRQREDRLIKDGQVMSAAKRGALERDIRTLKRELRRGQEEFRDDLNLRRNKELGKLQRNVITAIRQLAKEQKYDLVISDGVLFAGKRVDITDKVLSKLKQDFKK